MKREIKFRAKTIKDSITSEFWVYGDYVQNFCFDAHNDAICAICFNNDYWRVDSKTVGQYTGLKDKNEKEIYEGDVIHYDNGVIGKVIFKEGAFCAYDGYANNSDDAYLDISFDILPFDPEPIITVIGNIHDNPELLKQ